MSQGPPLYYRCTLMFITGRRCIGETWVDFQYDAYRMRHRRAHLALAAWHTMILSQYFFYLFCVFHQLVPLSCNHAFSLSVQTGLFSSILVELHKCLYGTGIYAECEVCQVKITDTNHAPCTHWHPPPQVGCVALSVDGSFSAANPLTKY